MAAIAVTRSDLTAIELRAAAGREKDSAASRRMLALAMVFDGADRTSAAEICGMDRQTLRDWVHRYNATGLAGLRNRKSSGRPPKLTAAQKAVLVELVEKGPDPARSKTPRSYQRKAARNLVPGRGAHWPARHADPCLGQTRDAPPCAARSALRMGLHFWRRLPAAPHHRSPRRADRQHRSHVHASQRNRGQRRTGRARSPCSRRRWISSRHRPRRTRQHHTCSPAALL